MSPTVVRDDATPASGRPTRYRIVVQGRLDARWSDRLGGLTLTTTDRDGEGAATTLEGRLQDEEELGEILESLYDLHLPILSVKKLGDEE